MVGHTGNLEAAIEAVTVTDACVKVRGVGAVGKGPARLAARLLAVPPRCLARSAVRRCNRASLGLPRPLQPHPPASRRPPPPPQELLDAVRRCGGRFLLTADHGNAEDMVQVRGSEDMVQVRGSEDMVQVGGSEDMVQVGGSEDMVQVRGSEDMVQVGGCGWNSHAAAMGGEGRAGEERGGQRRGGQGRGGEGRGGEGLFVQQAPSVPPIARAHGAHPQRAKDGSPVVKGGKPVELTSHTLNPVPCAIGGPGLPPAVHFRRARGSRAAGAERRLLRAPAGVGSSCKARAAAAGVRRWPAQACPASLLAPCTALQGGPAGRGPGQLHRHLPQPAGVPGGLSRVWGVFAMAPAAGWGQVGRWEGAAPPPV